MVGGSERIYTRVRSAFSRIHPFHPSIHSSIPAPPMQSITPCTTHAIPSYKASYKASYDTYKHVRGVVLVKHKVISEQFEAFPLTPRRLILHRSYHQTLLRGQYAVHNNRVHARQHHFPKVHRCLSPSLSPRLPPLLLCPPVARAVARAAVASLAIPAAPPHRAGPGPFRCLLRRPTLRGPTLISLDITTVDELLELRVPEERIGERIIKRTYTMCVSVLISSVEYSK